MQVRKLLIGLFAATALIAGACSSDSSSDDLASKVKDLAADQGETISDQEAECAAEFLVALVGEDEANKLVDDADEAGFDAAVEEAMMGLFTGESDVIDRLNDMSDECLELMEIPRDELEALSEIDMGDFDMEDFDMEEPADSNS